MSDKREASYEQFLKRYEELKGLFFSPKSLPQYDDDNEEIPSPYMTRTQIMRIFTEEMRVIPPQHRQDPPKFLDGSVGPAYVSPRASTPPARQVVSPEPQVPSDDGVHVAYTPDPVDAPVPQDFRPSIPVGKPRPKMIHCGVHGRVLAIMMDDDVLMCESCYKKLTPVDPVVDPLNEEGML